ncbi:hypothetical protein MIND_00947000 [Mycena indigotica]|uniref:Glycosyltransferase 61 catalytic domain-containing protein n=1 Tax=Mycena indigotica TaxID=2126181 RepID=A0A8H6SCR0_9AGAR|nr:uncharacterized protein MIND_00947000 [Mycena indigotica]KAF7297141.1 hypothetical protein MIND_00947000 [Mycena indigotica]
MAPAPPTPREWLITSILLLVILYYSNSRVHDYFIPAPQPHTPRPPHSIDTLKQNTQSYDARLTWGSKSAPESQVLSHVPGWSIIDKLYISNGTVYIVSDDPDAVPDRDNMYSKGVDILPGKEAEESRLPSDNDIQIITTAAARKLFGTGAYLVDGVTFLVNDPPQFVRHYYHWTAELIFGFWRTYSSLDPSIQKEGNTSLPQPRHMWFNRLDAFRWRDPTNMNQLVVRSIFPDVTMEFLDDWDDRTKMGAPFVFERVVLADRSSAMRAYNYQRYQRTAAVPFGLPGSVYWWQTLRNNVVQFAGMDWRDGSSTNDKPVITYISRQAWGRRILLKEDHERLVKELYRLRDAHGWEVNVVLMEKLDRAEQIRLAVRTTIMMGVHGNGLTNLIWMQPTPRTTVMEFFYPGGFAHDYEFTARSLGITHYGFWGSSSFTSPNLPLNAYPDGFQGSSIPIDAEAVGRLCHDRLTLSFEVDD